MAVRIIIKKFPARKVEKGTMKQNEVSAEVTLKPKNKEQKKKSKEMNTLTKEQIAQAENLMGQMNAVKVVKKDRSLIERTESSKIVVTEDNRQVLND